MHAAVHSGGVHGGVHAAADSRILCSVCPAFLFALWTPRLNRFTHRFLPSVFTGLTSAFLVWFISSSKVCVVRKLFLVRISIPEC
ncbi:uncharacterized protein V6R79_020052 [Siganus canaliculatus]